MEALQRVIVEYVGRDGINHYGRWVSGLDPQLRQRVFSRLAKVKNGNLGDMKPLGEGVTELRIDFGPGLRIYFGQEASLLVLLLTGGTKRTQDMDIALAKQLWREYKQGRTHASN
jgi:putative addiction module killer protein